MFKQITGLVMIMAMSNSLFAGFLPADRSIDWSACGVPAGASKTTQVINVVKDSGAKGDGVTDDSMAFIEAISALPKGGEVIIPPGKYMLKKPLVISRDNVVLRGRGIKKTMLIFDLENDPAVDAIVFAGKELSDWMRVVSGYEKGSYKLVVEDASMFSQGDFVEIQQENDPVIHYTRRDWNQEWAQEIIGQVFIVRETDNSSITLDEPLHISYSRKMSPVIRKLGAVRYSGVENLKIKRLDKSEGCNISMVKAAYCRVKGVESEYVMRSHVSIEQSYRCEVKASYFHHAFDYGGGGHGYGVEIKRHASNNLVEDNEFFNLRHSMMVHLGANGNVFGYNKSKQPVATGDHTPGTVICDISVHGHYPYMNLFEGNTVQKIEMSDWWGPCGPGNTFFKNTVEGEGILIKDSSNFQNLIGNRILNESSGIIYDSTIDPAGLIIHGNMDGNEIEWDEKLPRELPESLYKK